jgi:hypothetical protein
MSVFQKCDLFHHEIVKVKYSNTKLLIMINFNLLLTYFFKVCGHVYMRYEYRLLPLSVIFDRILKVFL